MSGDGRHFVLPGANEIAATYARSRLPRPARGERVGVRGLLRWAENPGPVANAVSLIRIAQNRGEARYTLFPLVPAKAGTQTGFPLTRE
jgi:hypothetical protein